MPPSTVAACALSNGSPQRSRYNAKTIFCKFQKLEVSLCIVTITAMAKEASQDQSPPQECIHEAS